MSSTPLRRLSLPVIVLALAGLLHILLAPMQFGSTPANAITGVLAGIALLVWAFLFWRGSSSVRLVNTGLALSGGLALLWLVSRLVTAPFAAAPGAWQVGGLVIFVLELGGFVGLLVRPGTDASAPAAQPRGVAVGLGLAVLTAAVLFVLGLLLQPLLPDLAAQPAMPGNSASMGASGPTVQLGDLTISQPWAGIGQTDGIGGVFLRIQNKGTAPDRLVKVTSTVSQMAQIHETIMDGSVMKMQELPNGLDIPAGGQVDLKRGSYHIMVIKLKQDLTPGDHVLLTLQFEKAGTVNVDAIVRAP